MTHIGHSANNHGAGGVDDSEPAQILLKARKPTAVQVKAMSQVRSGHREGTEMDKVTSQPPS